MSELEGPAEAFLNAQNAQMHLPEMNERPLAKNTRALEMHFSQAGWKKILAVKIK